MQINRSNETPSLRILFQDDSIAVCVKPVGIDSQNGMCSLLSAQTGCEVRCVHRLDRSVGGLMVYALSPAAAAVLSKDISENTMIKEYLSVCEGRPEPAQGEMRDLLYHDAARNKSYVVKRRRRGVRDALLTYRVEETRDRLSLVSVRLFTGRSHQIRVQFASRGLPLLGDGTYGAKERSGGIALWSYRLSFPHPASLEPLSFFVLPPASGPWLQFVDTLSDLANADR